MIPRSLRLTAEASSCVRDECVRKKRHGRTGCETRRERVRIERTNKFIRCDDYWIPRDKNSLGTRDAETINSNERGEFAFTVAVAVAADYLPLIPRVESTLGVFLLQRARHCPE